MRWRRCFSALWSSIVCATRSRRRFELRHRARARLEELPAMGTRIAVCHAEKRAAQTRSEADAGIERPCIEKCFVCRRPRRSIWNHRPQWIGKVDAAENHLRHSQAE